MNQLEQSEHQAPLAADEDRPEQADDGWLAYDAVPRDGPAVFVVDGEAWQHGQLSGAWLPADVKADKAIWQLSRTLGRAVRTDDLLIIDQVGLGPTMVDEDWLSSDEART